MFVNMVVLRVRVPGDPAFAELAGMIRERLLDAWEHQEMPFQKLVEALAPGRRPGVPPLYQLAFNHIDVGGFSRRSATTEDDLMLEVSGGQARLEYNSALFDPATATRLADAYQRVLAAIAADADLRLSALPVGTLPPAMHAAVARVAPSVADAAPEEPLAAPDPAPPGPPPAEWVAPRTAAEELVAQVWEEVLGRSRIGALDDFFDLGGHSLLALRVIARLSAAAEVDLPIQEFFVDTTVAGVAAAVERLLVAELDEMSEDEARQMAAGQGSAP